MAKSAAFRKQNAGQNTVPLYLAETVERTARDGGGVAMWPTPDVPNGGRSLAPSTSLAGKTIDGKKRQVGLQNVAQTVEAVAQAMPLLAKGVPNRVARLKALGNAVVPQVVEQIGRQMMEASR
jgi:hypothetical protein